LRIGEELLFGAFAAELHLETSFPSRRGLRADSRTVAMKRTDDLPDLLTYLSAQLGQEKSLIVKGHDPIPAAAVAAAVDSFY